MKHKKKPTQRRAFLAQFVAIGMIASGVNKLSSQLFRGARNNIVIYDGWVVRDSEVRR